MTLTRSRPTPYRTVLIANRGEIALRIIRTARTLGYRTVSVYSEADASAPHVRAADLAVSIGRAPPQESYLNIQAVLDAARLAGADAIHPGYGFLSENAEFADACMDANLVFIGPTGEMIRRMGDKAAAKDTMEAVGLPCIPGYRGDDQSDGRLLDEAGRIGWPVMIKAVAGGGGRGMRMVDAPDQFLANLASARSEAQASFGDSRVLLEKAVLRPRHIEVQVFGDRHGNAIHLFERDCSVQRRHQKLVEEAPSPFLIGDLRQRICSSAVAALSAVGYEGAGTLEFLADESGDFWFMEMNTRLQVEHPVTELVTGLDLVELQLRVAAGEPLGVCQEEISLKGHAIEVRLCAEAPQRDFLPQSGMMRLWRSPPDIRIETAMESGTVVSPYYDSMLAKLIVHGTTRDEARQKLISALDRTIALGLATNRAFLRRAIDDDCFAAGQADTGFIAERLPELVPPAGLDEIGKALAALLLHLTEVGGGEVCKPHRLTHTFPVPVKLRFDSGVLDAVIVFEGLAVWHVLIEDSSTRIEVVYLGDHELQFRLGGVIEQVAYVRSGDALWLGWRGDEVEVENLTYEAAAAPRAVGGNGILRSSMTGQVISVQAAPGDSILRGQPVLTVEAMKMEHVHCADSEGELVELLVRVGDQVSAGQVLARLSAAKAAPGASS